MEAVQAINSIADNKTAEDIIARSVPAMWPTLQTAISKIPAKEETEKHMRPQHEILEELVTGVRGISSRMREFDPDRMELEPRHNRNKFRFHPIMFDELLDMSSDNDGDSFALLMLAGLVRDTMPWLSEVLTETYRELKHANNEEAEKISFRLRRIIKPMIHGRMGKTMRHGNKSDHMLVMELPRIIDRIIEESIDFKIKSTKPDEGNKPDHPQRLDWPNKK